MAYDSLLMVQDQQRFLTAKAGGSILAGDLVVAVSGNTTFGTIGSRTSTYATTTVSVIAGSNDATIKQQCLGIALTNASSGNIVTVGQEGVFLLPTGSNGVLAGKRVYAVGYGVGGAVSYNNCCVEALTAGAGSCFPIGTALTSSASEAGFAAIRLNI